MAPPSEAEAHRLALARVAKMSSAELLQRSVKAGVYTPDGKLTPEYGGERLPYQRTCTTVCPPWVNPPRRQHLR